MTASAYQAAEIIKQRAADITPKLAIVLGSGLGDLANHIENPVTISYGDLPGYVESGVEGHKGLLHIGELGGVPVACMQGRAHVYEGTDSQVVKTMVRTLKLIGCEMILLTNAAGSLRKEVGPGRIMLITDHINMLFMNPLIGPNDNDFGPRFVGMTDAYDPALREVLLAEARALSIDLAEGVYVATCGPTFETPAEINAYRVMGGDAVGMSTIPEAIVARHCGMKVAAMSAITNFAAGMHDVQLSHDVTLEGAALAAKDLQRLVMALVSNSHNALAIE